jgi:putative tryptophan/tyrosine transport system substrate-binding protein
VDGGPQCPDRHTLGGGQRGVDATIREGTRRAAARPHSCAKHTHYQGAAATNAHHPHHFWEHFRSGGQRLRRVFPRPGGSVTGFSAVEPTTAAKWLELLKEVAPHVVRVAFLFNPVTAPNFEYYLNPIKAAAASVALAAVAAPVHDLPELESAVAAQAREPNGGLVVMPEPSMNHHRAEVISLAARYRLPAIYPYRVYTELGGLLSYGIDPPDNFRRAASYADRILKGAKPSELPVQAPVKFELVINLKTSKTLGLDVPLHLRQHADVVIE